jgi:hypothetical protein
VPLVHMGRSEDAGLFRGLSRTQGMFVGPLFEAFFSVQHPNSRFGRVIGVATEGALSICMSLFSRYNVYSLQPLLLVANIDVSRH